MGIKNIRSIYVRNFPNSDVHHPNPRTRMGGSGEFDLFPYDKKAHSDYHSVFSNLRIDEVWMLLDRIYFDIFESGKDSMVQWWLGLTLLEVGTEKKKKRFERTKTDRLKKLFDTAYLRNKYISAFGGNSLDRGRKFLKLMMLFMIFGTRLLDKTLLANSKNLAKFLKDYPCRTSRLWAFETCFTPGADMETVRLEAISIIRDIEPYSHTLL